MNSVLPCPWYWYHFFENSVFWYESIHQHSWLLVLTSSPSLFHFLSLPGWKQCHLFSCPSPHPHLESSESFGSGFSQAAVSCMLLSFGVRSTRSQFSPSGPRCSETTSCCQELRAGASGSVCSWRNAGAVVQSQSLRVFAWSVDLCELQHSGYFYVIWFLKFYVLFNW